MTEVMRASDIPVDLRIVTGSVTITDSHMHAWAGLTGDWHAVHVDEGAARRAGHRDRVVYAQLVFALTIGMVARTGFYEGGVHGLLGINDVRFHKALVVGQTITATLSCADRRQSTSNPNRTVMTLHYETVDEEGALVMSLRYSVLMDT
jgi:acyl dehydratase